MKKNCFLLTGFAVLSLGMAMVSCSSTDVYDENYAKNAEHNQRIAEYQAAFEQAFGKISKNHHWGFDKSTRTTRGAAESSVYNNYIWPANAEVQDNTSNAHFPSYYARIMEGETLQKLPFENYFVQHYIKGTSNGKKADGNSSMHQNIEKLQAYDYKNGGYIDVPEFTGGKCVKEITVHNDQNVKGTMLMLDMGTPTADIPQFKWIGQAQKVDKSWVPSECSNYLIKKVTNSDGTVEYYVCFAFFNENTDNNYYYSWILRIFEAKPVEIPTPYKERGRVMCEDLGTNKDFDFNDIVFDVTIFKDGHIEITLQATGGELPFTIAGRNVTLGKMKNTGLDAMIEPVTFTISAEEASSNGWTTVRSIPVVVTYPDGTSEELAAKYGEAPAKICTYLGVSWPDEFVRIDTAYKDFLDWVSDEAPEEWWIEHQLPQYVDRNKDNNYEGWTEDDE
jgi:hypothetical protein